MQSPQLLVLDEPAQGVDINRQVELYRLVNKVKDRFKCAVLIVSHDLILVMRNTDHVICLNKTICCTGKPVEIVHNDIFSTIFGHMVAQNLQQDIGVFSHSADQEHHQTCSNPECGC